MVRPPVGLGLLFALAMACSDGGGAAKSAASASAAALSAEATGADSRGSDLPALRASASAAPPSPLAGSAIVRDISWLAAPEQRGRGSGTDDEARAREWIVFALKDIGLEPDVRPFAFGRGRKSANVLVRLEPATAGKKEAVLLGGHYDHVGVQDGKIHPGADDNGSGTAIILAMVRELVTRRAEFQRPIIVVFFGAEETGLDGSRALVSRWDFKKQPISTMINIDMVGRPLLDQPQLWLGAKLMGLLPGIDQDHAIGLVLPDKPGALDKIARTACAEEGVQVVTIDDVPPRLRRQVDHMSRGRSDHDGFQRRGIPFLFFSSAESADYHAPGDTADKIQPEIVERRARAFLRTLIQLAQ